jgi:hypothetical protein
MAGQSTSIDLKTSSFPRRRESISTSQILSKWCREQLWHAMDSRLRGNDDEYFLPYLGAQCHNQPRHPRQPRRFFIQNRAKRITFERGEVGVGQRHVTRQR